MSADTVTVAVIDNTTGATLLSCTVVHGQLNEQKQLLKYQRVGSCGVW